MAGNCRMQLSELAHVHTLHVFKSDELYAVGNENKKIYGVQTADATRNEKAATYECVWRASVGE